MNTISIQTVIEELGGRAGAAAVCGITPDGVSKWLIIGVPPKHWAMIVAKTQGRVSYELLADLKRDAA